ncbi:hypothetical protein RM545_15790 [Zunongwangia sp. F260]|uniref:Lipoprotein n=1 Tax=Autumnicola lenta TaxID=3075593 RepID=A0ABU3CP76_9FLAO|nr:hypothetical protein [Zunongwangia sp. F260]MDT0648157.1 hypothetical protein [Zunongwangia sp. F260]
MKTIIRILCFFCVLGCNKSDLLHKTSKDYIDSLSKDVKVDFNVFVREVEVPSKNITVYRINSGTYNLEHGEIPTSYFEYKDHYVFIFYQDSIPTENVEKLGNKGLYKEKESFYSEEDYDEWILAMCNKKKHILIKDSWYRPLDSLESLKNFECKK